MYFKLINSQSAAMLPLSIFTLRSLISPSEPDLALQMYMYARMENARAKYKVNKGVWQHLKIFVLAREWVIRIANTVTRNGSYLSPCFAVMSVHDSSWTVSPSSRISKLLWKPTAKLDVTATAWPSPTLLCHAAQRTVTVTTLSIPLATGGRDGMGDTSCCNGV